MSKWIKKKIEKLSALLNADDSGFENNKAQQPSEEMPNKTVRKDNVDDVAFENIETLKEISIGSISSAVKVLGFGSTVISGIIFHSRFADNAVENLGIQSLIKSEEFIKQIKRTFKSKGIKYKEDFSLELITQSKLANSVTKLADGIGIELLTPTVIQKKIKAKIIATEGITWEKEYILEPTEKNYFIGRCRNPKIENGPKLHNDIAFVGIEEKEEEQYKINNYVSRSHAIIVYDKDLGAYKIYRSKFLNNPSHKIKIYNSGNNDFAGVSLTQSTVPHVLKDGDSICLNDKAVLEFTIIH